MIFNSFVFLLFFPLVAIGYFFLTICIGRNNIKVANTLSQFLLLAASLIFYGYWNIAYLVLILTSIIVTWTSGLLMQGRSTGIKRLVLTGSLVINLGILFFFKYYGFFTESVLFFFRGNVQFPSLNVLLPVGISFYTFQALGYSIDVYYGKVQAEYNFITYALFVTFFPQLVAGPIERTGNLLPQFKVNHAFDYDQVSSGLRLALWGMFKKVVIADSLAVYVDVIFGTPGIYPAGSLALATFFFAFQIYCDFSGYSDIAIGCARVLGFRLMTNFKQPYFSRSISEFWRRWHISLSTWFKDYLYIPLGGNRKGKIRQNVNLIVIFLVSGLWHGAAWNFVVWGGLHGMYQIIGRNTASVRTAIAHSIGLGKESWLKKIMQLCITFVLVYFSWIFFRANSMEDAFLIIGKLVKLPSELVLNIFQIGLKETVKEAILVGYGVENAISGFDRNNLIVSVFLILILLISDGLSIKIPDLQAKIVQMPLVLRWAGYYSMFFAIAASWNTESPMFIYFTF